MLLRSLNSYAITHGGDLDDAVTVGDTVLSRSDLLGAATSVAERIMGVDRVAVLAEPTARTVVAVVGDQFQCPEITDATARLRAADKKLLCIDLDQ